MSSVCGYILNDLWSRVDQADYDMMVKEAFMKLPTPIHKKFIERILSNDSWELDGEPDAETKEKYRLIISG